MLRSAHILAIFGREPTQRHPSRFLVNLGLVAPPPPLPSDFQSFQPPPSVFSGVMPPVGSVEDFPPSPFLPDQAEWILQKISRMLPILRQNWPTWPGRPGPYLRNTWGTCTRPFRMLRHRESHRPLILPFSWNIIFRSQALLLPPDFIHEYERVSKALTNLFRMALITSILLSRIPRSTSIRKGLPRSCLLSGLCSPLRTCLPLHRIVRKIENGNLFRTPHMFLQDWRSSKPR